MAFTRLNRKAALLLEKLKEKGFTSGNDEIEHMAMKVNVVRSWRTAQHPYRDLQHASDGIKRLFGIDDDRNLLSDAISVKQFSRFLGFSMQEGRRIIDQAYSKFYPIYSIFYSTEKGADEILGRLQGLHLLYRIESGSRVQEYTGRESNIMQPLARQQS